MYFSLGPVGTPQSITDQLLAVIRNDKIAVGDRLPGEKALAKRLEVSRPVLREALRVLEAAGIVDVRPGKGCYLVDDCGSLTSNSVWLAWLTRYRIEVMEILEVRDALERKAAWLAALRATPEDIEAMERAVQDMKEVANSPLPDPDQAYMLDTVFHRALYGATQNPLLMQLGSGVGGVLEADRRATMSIPHRIKKSAQDHQAVLDGIKARDPQAAREAASAHIKQVIQDLSLTNGQAAEPD